MSPLLLMFKRNFKQKIIHKAIFYILADSPFLSLFDMILKFPNIKYDPYVFKLKKRGALQPALTELLPTPSSPNDVLTKNKAQKRVS